MLLKKINLEMQKPLQLGEGIQCALVSRNTPRYHADTTVLYSNFLPGVFFLKLIPVTF